MSDLLDRLISKYGSKPRVDLDAIIDRLREGGELTEAQREILEFTPAQQLPGIAERWRNRRDFYRSTQDYFDPSDWRVDAMAGKSGALGGISAARLRAAPLTARRNAWQAGRDFITTNHYAASFPQVRVMVGMFRASNAELVGVATFSNAKESQANLYGGVDVDEIMELSRFVLLDDVPGNAETWFLARATETARQVHAMRRYELKVLLSFSDPVPRRSVEGFLTMPGHIGNIYQAHNALYVGYSSSKTLYLNPQGLAPDPRMLSKIKALDKRDEQGGREGARRLVEVYGAAPRRRGESHRDWLDRVLVPPHFRVLPHRGNLTYLWTMGDKRLRKALQRRIPDRLPYPKTPRQLYLNLYRKYERAWSRGDSVSIAQLATEILETWVRLTREDRKGIPEPPQFGVSCRIRGSRSTRRAQTLEQVMQGLVCP